MSLITPVILCGGAGTRLWPASRDAFPKQFLALTGDCSTFEMTLRRVNLPELFAPPLILTHDAFKFIVADQMSRATANGRIVLEPMRRDSGAAIAAAAEIIGAKDPQAVLLVLAADHLIDDAGAFTEAVKAGLEAARAGAIVTFGLTPTRPATAYGYIKPGPEVMPGVFEVAAFKEKPDTADAEHYIAEGYRWNSGNFLFRADVFLNELALFEPDMAVAANQAAAQLSLQTGINGLSFERLDGDAYGRSPQKSVDYSVMERTQSAAMVPAHFHWSDIGSWDALWAVVDKDAAGNAVSGPAELIDVHDSLISADRITTAVIGLDNIALIATPDAVLVAPRARTQDIKPLVDNLRRSHPALVEKPTRTSTPWGWFQGIDSGERFQVKRIMVKAGAALSLQRHQHRSEHWVVVSGTATVSIDGDTRLVRENESIHIPLGAWHRMANDGKIPLHLIEVQSGAYLGEDDIERRDDDYERD